MRAAYDEKNLRLYTDISQVFRIFFIPFYSAHARLVCVLDLTYDVHRQVYLIKQQNDLYQVNEWLKFISLGKGFAFMLFQFIATAVCVLCASIFSPIAQLGDKLA